MWSYAECVLIDYPILDIRFLNARTHGEDTLTQIEDLIF